MPNTRFHTPALYPSQANAWGRLGIDPRRFFRQDGTMDNAFFAVPSLLNAAPATPAPLPCAQPAPVLITITVKHA